MGRGLTNGLNKKLVSVIYVKYLCKYIIYIFIYIYQKDSVIVENRFKIQDSRYPEILCAVVHM